MITRRFIQQNRDTLFVFGDNVERRGFGGQAKEARGEFNAIGLPTKWRPNNDIESFFYEHQFEYIKSIILDTTFKRIEMEKCLYKKIVFFPNIGRGLANLQNTAPKILEYIESQIERIKNE